MSEFDFKSLEKEELIKKNQLLDDSLKYILAEIEKLDLYCGCEAGCTCLTREQHLLKGILHHIYGTFMQIDHEECL